VPDAQHELSACELTDEHLPPDTIVVVLARNSHRPRHLGIEIVEEDLANPVVLTGLRHLHQRVITLSRRRLRDRLLLPVTAARSPIDLAKIDKSR